MKLVIYTEENNLCICIGNSCYWFPHESVVAESHDDEEDFDDFPEWYIRL